MLVAKNHYSVIQNFNFQNLDAVSKIKNKYFLLFCIVLIIYFQVI